MPSVRRMILGHVMSGLCTKMNRTKKLQGDLLETPMKRCLSTFDITLLGKHMRYFNRKDTHDHLSRYRVLVSNKVVSKPE